MEKITIFTPTYNRAYILDKLYNSLLCQTNKNFEWLIVDDGSTDNTKKIVEKWIENNKIKIRYIFQQNQGKQIAFNNGVQHSDCEYFFCVDSDDYLTCNAIQLIIDQLSKMNNEKISGIIALRGKNEKEPIGGKYMPLKISQASLKNLYEKYRFKGDTALIYKTKILKQYPFVLEKGEKFIGEIYVYDQIDEKYEMILMNEIIYISEYLDDGYTKNTIKYLKENPYSYMKMKLQSSRISKKISYKIKHMAGYIAMCIYIKEKNMIKKSQNQILAICAYPFGLVEYLIRFKEKKCISI